MDNFKLEGIAEALHGQSLVYRLTKPDKTKEELFYYAAPKEANFSLRQLNRMVFDLEKKIKSMHWVGTHLFNYFPSKRGKIILGGLTYLMDEKEEHKKPDRSSWKVIINPKICPRQQLMQEDMFSNELDKENVYGVQDQGSEQLGANKKPALNYRIHIFLLPEQKRINQIIEQTEAVRHIPSAQFYGAPRGLTRIKNFLRSSYPS